MLVFDKLSGSRPLAAMRRLLHDTVGATSIEYGFLALLMAIPLAACLPPIATTVKAHYAGTASGFDQIAKAEEEAKAKENAKK